MTDATATVTIDAAPERIWHALTDPATIAQYFLGTHVDTDWKVGSPIVFRGEYQGNAYEDHGEVLAFEPGKLFRITHFSGDVRHVVAWELDGTTVRITQSENTSEAEVAQAEQTWAMVLGNLKDLLER